MKTTRVAVLALIMFVATGVPATAMQAAGELALAMAPPPEDEARADALQQEAESLFSEKKHWRRAARLLERSAALREAGDPDAFTCLLYAGRIRFALGDAAAAQLLMTKAGDHALARGAVVESADAYIDAAHAAVDARDRVGAAELVERARLLSDSPLLSGEQRSRLKARLPA